MVDSSNQGFRPPKQQRSEQTFTRILQSVRELLEETVFEEMTVSQIAAGAGCSVGAVYGRFENKEAILPHLLKVHYAEMEEDLKKRFSGGNWAGVQLGRRIEGVVDFLVSTAQLQPGMIRTLALRNYQRPESIPASIRASGNRMLKFLYDFLLEGSSEEEYHLKKIKVEVGLLMVSAALRERLILIGAPQASTLSVSDRDFASELKHALMSYLISDQS